MVEKKPPLVFFESLKEWQSFAPGLERVHFTLQKLGNPHQQFRHVLVGGTNGKGTVCFNLALNAPGKTGLFLSPHLLDVRERITLAGEIMPDSLWRRAHEHIKARIGEMELSYFEWLLVLAVMMFALEDVEFGVFEVGLGGRLDAANALDPELSVITNVSLDHMGLLGNTVEQIALEKIEIARRARRLLLPAELMENEKIANRLLEIGCVPYLFYGQNGFSRNEQVLDGALACLGFKRKWGGLAHLAGRREKVRDQPLLYLDGAHNEAGWQDLVAWVRDCTDEKVNVLCALSLGKDPQQFLEIIGPVARSVQVWNVDFEKVLPVERWPNDIDIVDEDVLVDLVREPLLVCGSLYMVGAFKTWLANQKN